MLLYGLLLPIFTDLKSSNSNFLLSIDRKFTTKPQVDFLMFLISNLKTLKTLIHFLMNPPRVSVRENQSISPAICSSF
jgi:hypothetical protein